MQNISPQTRVRSELLQVLFTEGLDNVLAE